MLSAIARSLAVRALIKYLDSLQQLARRQLFVFSQPGFFLPRSASAEMQF